MRIRPVKKGQMKQQKQRRNCRYAPESTCDGDDCDCCIAELMQQLENNPDKEMEAILRKRLTGLFRKRMLIRSGLDD